MYSSKKARLILQVGLAFVFFYAAGSAFLNPNNWYGYLPPFLYQFISSVILLKIFSTFEVVLGLWLLSGWKLFYSSLVAVLMLGGIIFFNFQIMDIVFRDVGLLFAALALAILSKTSA